MPGVNLVTSATGGCCGSSESMTEAASEAWRLARFSGSNDDAATAATTATSANLLAQDASTDSIVASPSDPSSSSHEQQQQQQQPQQQQQHHRPKQHELPQQASERVIERGSTSWETERIAFAKAATLPQMEAHSPTTRPATTHKSKKPASTSTSTSVKGQSAWSSTAGTAFRVRRGPKYNKHKHKDHSRPSLYEVAAMRYFNSDARCQAGVAHLLPLPVDELFPDGKVSHISDTAVPELLIVHFQLPYETPTMFRAKTDGAGGEVVLYLKPSQRFIEEISGERHMTPATHLFQRWCRLSETQPELRKRFKCMALVNELEKLGLSWLKPYNGKPVLITESGSVRRGIQDGVRYLEFSSNVHGWAYIAKKGFVSLIPRFKEMTFEVGFTIEATNDGEMPECMLGSVMTHCMDHTKFPKIPPELQDPINGGNTDNNNNSKNTASIKK